MESGPLPPHERTWRHPSELAAEEHALARAETTSPTTRMFAITTGSLGLVAVGLLMLAVTPGRSDAPIAISATTTPIDPVRTVAVEVSAPRAPVGLRSRPEALATPIGEGRFAVVTVADLGAAIGTDWIGSAVEVAVPSGNLRTARIVGQSGETVLVELDVAEPGPELADELPGADEIVTVLAEPPVTIVFDDLASLEVEEGTAVLDDEGDLVGLCSDDDDATRLVAIGDDLTADTGGDGPAIARDDGVDDEPPGTDGDGASGRDAVVDDDRELVGAGG